MHTSESISSWYILQVVENVVGTINSLLHWRPASVMTYNSSQWVTYYVYSTAHIYAYSEWGPFTTVTHMHNNIIINMQTYTVIWDLCIWVCCTNLHQCKTVIQLIIFNSTCWKCKGNCYSQMCVYLTGHCDIIISYYVQVALDTLLMSGRNIMFGEGT